MLIAIQSPRFSWELFSLKKGEKQTAWQIIVSDDKKRIEAEKGNIRDSGKRIGDTIFNIKLPGNSRIAGTRVCFAPHPFAYEKHYTNTPGWADATIQIPYLMLINYGDLEMVFEKQ